MPDTHTIGGTVFDAGRTDPIATSTGWTRTEREALTNEGLVKFRESVAKKILKVLVSANVRVSSFKPAEMGEKGNFFYTIGQWSDASLQFESWMRTHFMSNVFETIVEREVTRVAAHTAGDGSAVAARDVPVIREIGNLFTN